MKIAIIEDSQILAKILSTCLRSANYEYRVYPSRMASTGKVYGRSHSFLIINGTLDNFNAGSFMRRYRRSNKDAYILGICTKGDWRSKVNLLNEGADDVLSYPFPSQELIARIEALTRRPKRLAIPKPIKAQGVTVDPIQKSVKYRDTMLPIRNKEYALLEYLMKNKNRPVSRKELIGTVWDYKEMTGSNTIDVHISKLRGVLPVNGIIETVHGIGYKLCDSANEQRYRSHDDMVHDTDIVEEHIPDEL